MADGGFATTANTPLVIPAAALLGNDNEPNGYPLAITAVTSPLRLKVASVRNRCFCVE